MQQPICMLSENMFANLTSKLHIWQVQCGMQDLHMCKGAHLSIETREMNVPDPETSQGSQRPSSSN